MPHYMHQWVYSNQAIMAMVGKPHNREDIVRVAINAFGGKLHQFYFTMGEYDGISISEFPDDVTAMACMMAIVAQGGVRELRSTLLLTAEDSQRAMVEANKVIGPPPVIMSQGA